MTAAGMSSKTSRRTNSEEKSKITCSQPRTQIPKKGQGQQLYTPDPNPGRFARHGLENNQGKHQYQWIKKHHPPLGILAWYNKDKNKNQEFTSAVYEHTPDDEQYITWQGIGNNAGGRGMDHTIANNHLSPHHEQSEIDKYGVEDQTILTNGVANGELRKWWGVLELWHSGKLLAVLVGNIWSTFGVLDNSEHWSADEAIQNFGYFMFITMI